MPENLKNICNFEFFHSGFPHSQDKRAGISKIFLSFFTLFLYIPWLYAHHVVSPAKALLSTLDVIFGKFQNF